VLVGGRDAAGMAWSRCNGTIKRVLAALHILRTKLLIRLGIGEMAVKHSLPFISNVYQSAHVNLLLA
jgi:hypothetical protein